MSYQVLFEPAADRDLDDLPPKTQARVVRQIEALADTPRPAASRELSGRLRGLYRLRVGDYRVAYAVDEPAQEIMVWAVGPRRGFYERLACKR